VLLSTSGTPTILSAKLLDEKHVFESDTIPATITGRGAGREFMKTYVSAFPDLHFQIDQMLASGDFVATRWTEQRRRLLYTAINARETLVSGASSGE